MYTLLILFWKLPVIVDIILSFIVCNFFVDFTLEGFKSHQKQTIHGGRTWLHWQTREGRSFARITFSIYLDLTIIIIHISSALFRSLSAKLWLWNVEYPVAYYSNWCLTNVANMLIMWVVQKWALNHQLINEWSVSYTFLLLRAPTLKQLSEALVVILFLLFLSIYKFELVRACNEGYYGWDKRVSDLDISDIVEKSWSRVGWRQQAEEDCWE